MPVNELSPDKLRRLCAPEAANCKTSEELGPVEGIIGQDRALKALKFGIDMKGKGFNIYVGGLPGTGKRPATRNYLETIAASRPVPPDWCYVYNFDDSYEPKALSLPAGRGRVLQKDMKKLVDQVKRAVPAALQSTEFVTRTGAIRKRAEGQRDKILSELNTLAQKYSYGVRMTQLGISIIPVYNGKPVAEDEFQSLAATVKKKFEENRDTVRGALDKAGKQIIELDAKTLEELRKLRDDSLHYAIGGLINVLTATYQELPEVARYLTEVRDDILENPELFIGETEQPSQGDQESSDPVPSAAVKTSAFRRYEVNVIVDNAGLKGVPVIVEDNPTFGNLFGKIEKESRFGALMTDFTLIKGGSMQKANGGYIILGVNDVLSNAFVYDGLKRTLQNETISIEETAERLGATSIKSLTPQPIPMNMKVILAGDPGTYQVLYQADPDFKFLFKVKADFDDLIEWNDKTIKIYGNFVHTLCETEGLNHLEASAIAKVVEYGSRLAEDQNKLSTRFPELADIVREASFYASQDNSKYIKDTHVSKALDEKVYRSDLVDQKFKEMIQRGIILIDTSGAKAGQVNGLSVISLGDFEFGQPSRITASIGMGRGGVIDIERESKLGGQIHTKGVLIISGYLANKYAHDKPLTLSCRLVFEQSYGGVDGDSASSTELYAILSALADLPIKQNFAVTGSVNQKGEVQAIGGANEKIEGFYAVCKARGLKGDEGILVPRSNIQHLMLNEEVVVAVKQGKFHIYPIESIDEGIELLTGVKAGERKSDGSYELGSVHYGVDKRLTDMAKGLTQFVGISQVAD